MKEGSEERSRGGEVGDEEEGGCKKGVKMSFCKKI